MIENKEIKKEKQWIPRNKFETCNHQSIAKISKELGINLIVAQLLYNRGCRDVESARSFINMDSVILANPFDMKDMKKGIERVHEAIVKKEKIAVYGDYDVDGVTSVSTLYLYLKEHGAIVEYYIPNRAGEGYGVSNNAIDNLAQNGTKLIITVDTGITANEEIKYAKTIGVDFVITDHHECHIDIPEACAVINPHRPDCEYPFKELAGVGVVFKFVCAYEEFYSNVSRSQAAMNIFAKYADLVAIGTIADVMPIKSENRIIVSYGLKLIENSNRVGINALIDASSGKSDSFKDRKRKRTKITSSFIGYTIAPRINAAGRIKSASIAVELFLTNDATKALEIAEILCEANRERQSEENKIMQEAYDIIDGLNIKDNPVIVLDANDWHHGVIGIVSSRITERYSRPSILVSFEGNNNNSLEDIGKGSGRSIKGMNLVDALCYCDDLLLKFGGHELAAGLSVTRGNLPLFREKINEYAKSNLSDDDMIPIVETDSEIKFSDVTVSLAEGLRILEPYGVDNPVPVFVIKNIFINEIIGVSEGKHTKLILSDGRHTISGMYFSFSAEELGLKVGDTIDVLCNVDLNEWGGRKNIQLTIRDIKTHNGNTINRVDYKTRYEEIRNGASFTSDEEVLPTRDDFAAIYKLLIASYHAGRDILTHKDICGKVSCYPYSKKIGYIKLKVIIMVMRELNIVTIDEISSDTYKFKLHYHTSKTDLEKSGILRKLRGQQTNN